jgi:predicted AAA+ superfamily ATPase
MESLHFLLENPESNPKFQGMIARRLESVLVERLSNFAAVALVGPRQVGKTTLAHGLNCGKAVHYLDLERPSDLAKLADPELYLGRLKGQLVILDEVQRVPELFPVLRGLIDERRREGEKTGQFLILGSASPELLRQSSESLAGRLSYLELPPLGLDELPGADGTPVIERHWLRGGFPESFLSRTDAEACQWNEDFLRACIERDMPQLGVEMVPQHFRRLLSMLALQQGATLNASRLASALGIDGKTVRRYLDLLEGLFLVRLLPPWSGNAAKRMVKAPKVYWRDSGMVHALAGICDIEALLGHPVCGNSWEGYCIEQILNRCGGRFRASFYRTHAGAEIDLVLESPDRLIAVEIKRTLSPKVTPAFLESMRTLGAAEGVFVMPSGPAHPLTEKVRAQGLHDFLTNMPAS